MNRKLIFFLVSIAYLILISYGLYSVYTVEATLRVKEPPKIKPENKIAIARTEIFGKLERPQVIFNHGKHEEAYKTEGCTACHPEKDGQVIFDFPMNLKKRDKTSVMNAYHDACIECHKKSAKKEKTGPVNCGDCHKEQERDLIVKHPKAEFDFYVHDKHVKKLKEKLGKDDCGLCHHSYDIEEEDEALRLVYEPGTEESCYYCHDLEKKRGPELKAIQNAAAQKGLSMRRASHQQCLNCHLKYQDEYLKKGDKEAVPTDCSKCHTGKYKTVAELEKVPRPDRDQKDKPFINIENSKMKGVTFDHKTHETYSRTCRSCHHETLNACNTCHSLTGKPEGNGINIAAAYHHAFSEHSCAGCHNKKKEDKKCAGCHHLIPAMDLETMNPKKETCAICHTGKKDQLPMPKPLSTAGLNQQKVKKEVEIKILEKEFEPSKFPHMDIINELVKISNDSKMATYFHRNLQTLCEGCHHRSAAEAEAQKDTPPNCKNCHMTAYDRQNLNKTTLLSAYHRQCLGCHEKMELEKGRKCTECHKAKPGDSQKIITMRNEKVVKQNTSIIINEWRPE
ncbi:MAG: cytochrome c3 family protein [Nitrospira sp.]|nr:cytochrome c3 family protein [Nitrospira sp.]